MWLGVCCRALCAKPVQSPCEGKRSLHEPFSVAQLAIYSEADRLQPHRYKADESYEVGAPDMTPVQCYLDYEGILALAKSASLPIQASQMCD